MTDVPYNHKIAHAPAPLAGGRTSGASGGGRQMPVGRRQRSRGHCCSHVIVVGTAPGGGPKQAGHLHWYLQVAVMGQ